MGQSLENHRKIRGESLEHHWEIIVFWGIPGYSPAYSRVSAGIVAGPRYPYVSWCILERPGVSWRSPSEPRGNLRRVTKPSRIQETALPVSMYSQVGRYTTFEGSHEIKETFPKTLKIIKKWSQMASLGRLLGGSWDPLGVPWDLLGVSWGRLGLS